jgi:hypothetical protein
MANLIASDNPFPSILIEEGTEPAAPAAGHQRIYVDSTSHLPMIVNSAGTDTALGGGSGEMVATSTIWDAAGDLVQGTGANTGAKLTAGTAGQFLKSAGAAAANLWAFPPGYEIDYIEKTSNTSITATTEATANTIVTGAAVAYDGSTVVLIEFYAFSMNVPTGTTGLSITAYLYDGSSSIGFLGRVRSPATASAQEVTVRMARRLTPSNATHTYSIRAAVTSGTGSVDAGAGGSGNVVPCFMRITKV